MSDRPGHPPAGRFSALSAAVPAIALALVLMTDHARSIETVIPAVALFLILETLALGSAGLAALRRAGSDSDGHAAGEARLSIAQACFSLVMAGLVLFRPIYSILTLSFVLLQQLLIWSAGAGAFALARGLRSATGNRAGLWRRLQGLLLISLTLLGQLSPGAGALDRRWAIALGLVMLALTRIGESLSNVGTSNGQPA